MPMTPSKNQPRPQNSVSSWSLHRALGRPAFYGPDARHAIPADTHNRGDLSLLELPQAVADFGIHTLEICHFHLPMLDAGYLRELNEAITDAGVELFSLLVDDGDLTHPQTGARDAAWIESWVEVAAALGAQRMRAIAGKQEPMAEALALSTQRLGHLAERAAGEGVRLMTENWFALTSTPQAVSTLLEELDGRVGLCLDFGNWHGEEKYAGLAAIARYAESCHAKAQFTDGIIDGEDYARCLEITADAGFRGPYTLIFDNNEPNEWAGLAKEREYVLACGED